MQIDHQAVTQHKQLDNCSCIPMSVELVLKLLGRVPADYYALQQQWANRTDGSFAAFDGRTLSGVRFKARFTLARDEQFPLDDLFRTIEAELNAGRFVIVSLQVPGGWHMFVIYAQLPSQEFRALSKFPGRTEVIGCDRVRALIREMKGTDILTYEIVA